MKNRGVKLSIEKPCSESWAEMTGTTHGAFCGQCQKEVIDFSKLTDNQIIAFLNTQNASVCGKLKATQVDRVLMPAHHNSYQQPNYYKLLFGLFISTFWNHSVLAKSNVFDSQKQNTFFGEKQLIESDVYEPKKDSSKHIIKGQVLDKENNEPIPFANVFIKDFGIGVSTDLDGKFSLSIPDSISTNPFTLKISYVGYNSLEINNITVQNIVVENIYYLKESEPVFMGMIIQNEPKKKKWWQRKSK